MRHQTWGGNSVTAAESRVLPTARPLTAIAWLLLTDNFTLDSQWVSSVLVSLPKPGHFLSKKKTLYSVSYMVKKDIWEDRLCSLLLLTCNSTVWDRIHFPVHKSVYYYPTDTPLNAISFTIALLQSYLHLLFISSQLLWLLKSCSAFHAVHDPAGSLLLFFLSKSRDFL